MLVRILSLSQVVMVLVVGLESQQVVSLLGVLPLVLNTGMGVVVALRWRGGMIHGSPFVGLVLLQAERIGFLRMVTGVVFVEVALVGKKVWFVLTPLSSKWLGTGFTFLVLTPVLSRLFAHVLVFEFQVGDLKNIWVIDSGWVFNTSFRVPICLPRMVLWKGRIGPCVRWLGRCSTSIGL
jgi:hypothetical protein